MNCLSQKERKNIDIEMKLCKGFPRIDLQTFCFGFFLGCILVSLTYLAMNNRDMVGFTITSFQQSSWKTAPPRSLADGRVLDDGSLGDEDSKHGTENEFLKNSSSRTSETPSPSDESLPNIKQNSRNVTLAEGKVVCDFSNPRTDVCNVHGDVRIIGKMLSSVMVATSSQGGDTERNHTWQVRPYPRFKMGNVREVNIKEVHQYEEALQCDVNHAVPGIIFSDNGLAGNYFHDFIEVLVPLFKTAYQFRGEVQLLLTDYKPHWVNKYSLYFKKISNHDIINYDADDRVHCFKHVIVGLNFDGELIIDPSKHPKGYSMFDFTKLMRRAYSLERDYPLTIGEQPGVKPRLFIISRTKSRKLVNSEDVALLAKDVGFETEVADGDEDVARFSRIVNSCDVLMGVHGSGLTNSVFLPTNAVLIQVVPFGKLEFHARISFGEPAKNMKLRYLDYSITAEESTLIELYPRDDPVLKDPDSVHRGGWGKMAEVYLNQQDVKLDLRRFRPVLEKAFGLLKEKVEQ